MFSRQVAEVFDVKLNVDKVIEDAEDELDSLPDEDDWLEILDFIEDNIDKYSLVWPLGAGRGRESRCSPHV